MCLYGSMHRIMTMLNDFSQPFRNNAERADKTGKCNDEEKYVIRKIYDK